jgi:hypothetical protein
MRPSLRLFSPRDYFTLVRMAAWAPALPFLKFALPLPRLVRLLAAKPRRRDRDPQAERRIARLAAVLYRARGPGMRDNCLERSLVTYRFLGRANARPELIVGMRVGQPNIVGHVWVTVDGNPVHDPPRELAEMTQMMSFDPSGELTT